MLLAIGGIVLLAAGGAVAFLFTLTHPDRDRKLLDPADLLLRTEDVTFPAPDNVMLSGWFLRGRPSYPVILLCHDLGASRSMLLNSAAPLNHAGFPILLFDFRGHGQSGGKGSTLGVDERLDVEGAIAYLRSRNDTVKDRFGVWGIGMGAYAATLAAKDEPAIVALALDALYPDVPTQLDRMVRADAPPAVSAVMPLLHLFYEPYFGFRLRRFSVAGSLSALADRNFLFIAGEDPPERFAEQRRLYDLLPEGGRADKNLLALKTSVVTGLYADDKKKYDDGLVEFFGGYLGRAAPRAAPAGGLQVVEPK